MLSTEAVLRFFLPEVICDYFEVTCLDDHAFEKRLDVYMDERKVVPLEYESLPLISYGFTDYTILQDFPIKGKAVYLHLRRRKWQNKSTGEIVTRNWDFAFHSTRLTESFASFLKGANREQSSRL